MKRPVLSVTRDDCERQVFAAGGPGGQNQNKRHTGVRWIHPPSGARGESREYRTQGENSKAAWRRMAESVKFQLWLARQLSTGPTPEERVEKDMAPENLKVEVKQDGRWVDGTPVG